MMSAFKRESVDATSERQIEEAGSFREPESAGETALASLKRTEDGEREGRSAPLSITPVRSSRGPLRIGAVQNAGAPSASSGTAGDALLANLASEIAQLRATADGATAVDPDVVAGLRKDIAAIKGSIEHVEAFVSIALVAKLDQMIGDKITAVHRIEASRRRLSRWLTVFVVLTLALAFALFLEMRTGWIAPLLEAAGAGITQFISQASGVAAHGTATVLETARGLVSGQ